MKIPENKKVNLAVVGLGYWGPNLLRNFDQLPGANVTFAIDQEKGNAAKINKLYPHIETSAHLEDALGDKTIDAIVIATSAVTHFELAKKALLADKDVFVEKPITLETGHAEELIKLANERNQVLMVGHLLMYHSAVRKLKEYIDTGQLGDIYYLYSTRVNLGQIRKDENALWSLGPHDISVILYLLNEEPVEVMARGESYIRNGVHDVVFVSLKFADKITANIQLSWLDPHKVRKLTIVGNKKMVAFDDMEPTEKLKIYDKGAHKIDYDTYGEYISLRFGDIHIPRIIGGEPLREECQHFLDCIANRSAPLSDGVNGLQVLKVLDAAQHSLDTGSVVLIEQEKNVRAY